MLEIDQLAIGLPAGFAPRALRLARLTAQALAAHGLQGDARLASVQTAPLRVDAARPDHAIARQIAGHIARQIAHDTAAGSA